MRHCNAPLNGKPDNTLLECGDVLWADVTLSVAFGVSVMCYLACLMYFCYSHIVLKERPVRHEPLGKMCHNVVCLLPKRALLLGSN